MYQLILVHIIWLRDTAAVSIGVVWEHDRRVRKCLRGMTTVPARFFQGHGRRVLKIFQGHGRRVCKVFSGARPPCSQYYFRGTAAVSAILFQGHGRRVRKIFLGARPPCPQSVLDKPFPATAAVPASLELDPQPPCPQSLRFSKAFLTDNSVLFLKVLPTYIQYINL